MKEEVNKNNHHLIRIFLWTFVVLGIALVGYFASRDTSLFKAELAKVGSPSQGNLDSVLYIPDNYTAHSPQSTDTVSVIVGGGGIGASVASIEADFLYNRTELTFQAGINGECLSFTNTALTGPLIQACTIIEEAGDMNRLEIQIATTQGVNPSVGNALFKLKFSVRSGLAENHIIDITNDSVVARTLQVVDIDTIDNIATGQITIVLEAEDDCADVDCGDYGICINGACSCDDGYAGDACNNCDIGYIGYPNCVVPQFDDLEELKICMQEDSDDLDNCAINSVISLNSTDSIGLIAIGTIPPNKVIMSFRDVAWVAEPVNRLDDSALAAGRLERGDAPGNASVFVEIQKSDATFVRSVPIAAYVNPGPVIEYARRIGEEPIVRNGRVDLSVKISDVDDISDLQDIRTTIARYTGAEVDPTYNQITADSVKFSPTPFASDEIIEINDDAEGGGAEGNFFRIYQIPVDIPNDMNITDGNYYILLEVTDMAGYMDNDALPIYIGAQASGDVNGDGNVSMLDVVLVFQIASGELDPTPTQLQAADVNGDGNVTNIDVTILFNQVNQ